MSRRFAPLRRVVERTDPDAVDTFPDATEVYECGHVEERAPVKIAERRRCVACLKGRAPDIDPVRLRTLLAITVAP